MIIRLTGEDFEFHYGFINWRNKVILDIGADFGSTAECFLACGATKVYAIEGNENFYSKLVEFAKGKQIVPIKKFINSPNDFIDLFNNFKADIIKIDCEECEVHFLDIPGDIIRSTKEYVIECHSPNILSKMLDRLKNLGYDIATVKNLSNIISLIHAIRGTNMNSQQRDKKTQDTIDEFTRIYYGPVSWPSVFWLGIPIQKNPSDLWIYQEIIFEIKPDIIIETGTFTGGSTLFMAHICDIIGKGKIISIDTEPQSPPKHNRIIYLHGSSISEEIVSEVKKNVQQNDKVLVILDSVHNKDYVLKEMTSYAGLVSIGSYLIVEDTCINNNPVFPGFGPGPMEAIQYFLETNRSFLSDLSKEKFFLTFNPKGYLKRIS